MKKYFLFPSILFLLSLCSSCGSSNEDIEAQAQAQYQKDYETFKTIIDSTCKRITFSESTERLEIMFTHDSTKGWFVLPINKSVRLIGDFEIADTDNTVGFKQRRYRFEFYNPKNLGVPAIDIEKSITIHQNIYEEVSREAVYFVHNNKMIRINYSNVYQDVDAIMKNVSSEIIEEYGIQFRMK
jgi:hypothetical protein